MTFPSRWHPGILVHSLNRFPMLNILLQATVPETSFQIWRTLSKYRTSNRRQRWPSAERTLALGAAANHHCHCHSYSSAHSHQGLQQASSHGPSFSHQSSSGLKRKPFHSPRNIHFSFQFLFFPREKDLLFISLPSNGWLNGYNSIKLETI